MSRPKGLKRAGLRSYRVGNWIITRDRPWRWWVRHEAYGQMPMDFFAVMFRSLGASIAWIDVQLIEDTVSVSPIVSRVTRRRGPYRQAKLVCARCRKEPRAHGKSWCFGCYQKYMRAYRKSHPMSEEDRIKDRARSYAGVYLRRGKIQRRPCIVGGCENPPEMHHEDYSKPLEILWICKKHHRDYHDGKLTIPPSTAIFATVVTERGAHVPE